MATLGTRHKDLGTGRKSERLIGGVHNDHHVGVQIDKSVGARPLQPVQYAQRVRSQLAFGSQGKRRSNVRGRTDLLDHVFFTKATVEHTRQTKRK